ncbi:MAG: hypothetical protein GC178_12880 [Flavobacteriales bacterium]|nr:hypothetical protein [Flavobacteriales bacterium]
MLRILFAASLVLVSTLSCSGQSVEFSWLIGSWKRLDGQTKTIETWKLKSDSSLIGEAQMFKNEELMFMEFLSINTSPNKTEYVAVLPNKTAFFRMTSASVYTATFCDPENDFPSTIIYTRKDSVLEIILEGADNQEILEFIKQ